MSNAFAALFDRNSPENMARRAEQMRGEAVERAALLAAHEGSEEAVLAWTEQERLLRAAVLRWAVFGEPPAERWMTSLDGYKYGALSEVPPHVIQAVSDAYLLPSTIADAAAELQLWDQRSRDLGLVLGNTDDSQLDLPARIRYEVVHELLETGLRATSVGEVLIRYRYWIEKESSVPQLERAILLDLEQLADKEAAAAPDAG